MKRRKGIEEEKRDWRRKKGIGGGKKGLEEEKRDWRRKGKLKRAGK